EAVTQLQDKNFTVAPLNLANTENNAVPDDADVVVIAGLRQALFESEVIALRDYLEQGGSLFVMVDPQIETGLEVLMSQWGVVPEKTIVIDTSPGGQAVGLGPAVPLVTDYGDHPITEAFNQGRSFYQVARPLQIREVPNIEVSPLLFTSQESYAETVEEGSELTVDPDRPPEGPFSLGVALSRPAVVDVEDILPEPEAPNTSAGEETDAETSETEGETAETTAPETANSPAAATGDVAETETNSADEPPADNTPAEDTLTDDALSTDAPRDSRMVVIGNSTFATDGQFNRFLNGDVFLNSVSWLSQIDNPTLSIQPKEATNRRFNMAVRQEILLTLLALVVFPLAGLIGAGTLWARRR
ncbi:MAG: Gldg family protein, partial [Cyanobacteria bacterium P01_F01_bin.3]